MSEKDAKRDNKPLVWVADEGIRERTVTAKFMERHGIASYRDLVARSIAEPEWFWHAVSEFLGIGFDPLPRLVLDDDAGAPWAKWFVGAGLNLVDVCVRRWAALIPQANAIVEERESGEVTIRTFAELQSEVSRAAAVFAGLGITPGDRVALLLPMCVEAVVAFLACAQMGAVAVPIFSGFGAAAIATRLADSDAKLLVTSDGTERRGRFVDIAATAAQALSIHPVSAKIMVERFGRSHALSDAVSWDDAVSSAPEATVYSADAESPVLLAYTSGTTGRPKGAVHVHGGFTVKVLQEAAFQTDIQQGDVVSWISDLGWIMGPWTLVGTLGNGATLALYDGAPDYEDAGRLWRFVARHQITTLGVSPSLVRALRARGNDFLQKPRPASLRIFGSTGEPWDDASWLWLFEVVGERAVPIVNLSGGTEVGASLLSVNLLQGLKSASLGGPALGMAVDVVDSSGRSVRGEVGELVCRAPWPAMTRGLWHDPERYLETYWNRLPGTWVHGDWASVDEDGFWYLHGRSDDTLNIAGKRIGPAEIEAAVMRHPVVGAAAAVGVPNDLKGETVLVLVTTTAAPSPGLGDELVQLVTDEFGKPFKPSVRFVDDLPRTTSAKILRRAIRAVALGEAVGDVSTLENPDSLEAIRRLFQARPIDRPGGEAEN